MDSGSSLTLNLDSGVALYYIFQSYILLPGLHMFEDSNRHAMLCIQSLQQFEHSIFLMT